MDILAKIQYFCEKYNDPYLSLVLFSDGSGHMKYYDGEEIMPFGSIDEFLKS
jgi:hypothetical protein